MDFKLKFGIGETIFFIESNRVKETEIRKVQIVLLQDQKVEISYYDSEYSNPLEVDKIFTTKEALLKSL